jgi:hypothetical protein
MTNISSTDNPRDGKRFLEWVLSIIGALDCIIVVVIFSISQIPYPDGKLIDIWPFPLLYFIEISLVGILSVVAVTILRSNSASKWSAIPWICSGIILAFVILGAWTIGFFLIPAMICFLFVGIFADKRTQGDIPLHIVFFVGGGIAQASFVFLTLLG